MCAQDERLSQLRFCSGNSAVNGGPQWALPFIMYCFLSSITNYLQIGISRKVSSYIRDLQNNRYLNAIINN